MKSLLTILFVVCFGQVALSQVWTLRGKVSEKSSALPQAHIQILPDSINTVADDNGDFSVRLPAGDKTIIATFVGYKPSTKKIKLSQDVSIEMQLQQEVSELKEVVIFSDKYNAEDQLRSTRTSSHSLSAEEVNAIPVLGGEADVIKTLQLLPGTVKGVEGSSDLFVRGGAADQNLVLLDGAPIYNTSHLFGFLSVFNPDVLQNVESINGGFPAQYGGRLSSILSIDTKNRIPERTHVSADVGLIASRLYVEQPLVKDKLSIWVSGRRTYIDKVVKPIGIDLPYFFYDLNGKLIWKPGKRDHVELSYYGGEDRLDYFRDRNGDGFGQSTGYHSGNNTQTLHWNRNLSTNWNSKLTLFRTAYRYNLTSSFGENNIQAFSNIQDLGFRYLISNDSLTKRSGVVFGAEGTRHALNPNVINTSGVIAEFLNSSSSRGRVANEMALFAQYDINLTDKLRLSTGFRMSSAFVGDAKYFVPEPRVAARYRLDEKSSLKISYSRMAQYLHRVSSSAISSPTDIWYPVTDSIKPQLSHQVGIAYQRNIPAWRAMFSVESYYKTMNQLVGYEEGTNLFFNTDFESKLIQGQGKAYGFEFLLRKQAGKFTGWLNYTLSWSWRRFDEINSGNWFHARYDRRHNGAVVMQYQFAPRWSASLVWEYISGSRFTPIIGQYAITSPSNTGIDLVPVFAPINSVKLTNTHRLDFGVKYKSRSDRRYQWQVFAGVYNAYNRANPIMIVVTPDSETGALRYQQPGLFGFLPFVSYGFAF